MAIFSIGGLYTWGPCTYLPKPPGVYIYILQYQVSASVFKVQVCRVLAKDSLLRYSLQIVDFAKAPDFLAPTTYLVTSPYLVERPEKKEGRGGARAFSI